MISPSEIKVQALKWWKPFLQSHLTGEPFFPKTIDRIGKVQSGHIIPQFQTLQSEIATLYQHSKEQTGIGYRIQTVYRSFRRSGSHELPDKIVFETTADYISCVGRKKEWTLFVQNYEQIFATIPQLKFWVLPNCLWLTEDGVDWTDILNVCRYFIEKPRPDVYLRQLPLAVHTKFIEENSTLVQSLLDFLIPEHIRNAGQRRFAERYFLRYDEPLVRLRLQDAGLDCLGGFTDVSIPLSNFETIRLPVQNILITENKMNFLALPALPSTIAVWSGGGFNISYLKNATWLGGKNIFYWGDIDEHGFQILHQLRSYYPKAHSVMMDEITFHRFFDFVTTGARNPTAHLTMLSPDEAVLFRQLQASDKNRLEQEKIPQDYVDVYLTNCIALEHVTRF